MYPKNAKDCTPVGRMERKIVRSLIRELLAQGYALAVFNGENAPTLNTDEARVIDAIMETDEDILKVFANGQKIGEFCLVYGNDGYDVIADNSLSVENIYPITKQLIAKLDE